MRVKVVTDRDGRVAAVDLATGRPLQFVSVATYADAEGRAPRAVIELLSVEMDAELDATFVVVNPETGQKSRVKRIEFQDGSVFEA